MLMVGSSPPGPADVAERRSAERRVLPDWVARNIPANDQRGRPLTNDDGRPKSGGRRRVGGKEGWQSMQGSAGYKRAPGPPSHRVSAPKRSARRSNTTNPTITTANQTISDPHSK